MNVGVLTPDQKKALISQLVLPTHFFSLVDGSHIDLCDVCGDRVIWTDWDGWCSCSLVGCVKCHSAISRPSGNCSCGYLRVPHLSISELISKLLDDHLPSPLLILTHNHSVVSHVTRDARNRNALPRKE